MARGITFLLAALALSTSVPSRADDTVDADPTAGKRHYALCSACHGPQGEGNRELGAPALAGREAWYLSRQLASFRSGIRGGHSEDIPGQQMRAMALVLPDDQALHDVAAYMSSLDSKQIDKKEVTK